jgi:hypothetical protein
MADISVFPDERHSVFFMEGYAYVDDAITIQQYVPADGGWTKAGHEIKLPKDFQLDGDRPVSRRRSRVSGRG